jgi:hypothetical protein
MSLAMDVAQVAAVLLADGWHKVDSFGLGAWEFVQEAHEGGGKTWTCSEGATWQEKGLSFYCPLAAILAVRLRAQNATPKKPTVPTGVGRVRRG